MPAWESIGFPANILLPCQPLRVGLDLPSLEHFLKKGSQLLTLPLFLGDALLLLQQPMSVFLEDLGATPLKCKHPRMGPQSPSLRRQEAEPWFHHCQPVPRAVWAHSRSFTGSPAPSPPCFPLLNAWSPLHKPEGSSALPITVSSYRIRCIFTALTPWQDEGECLGQRAEFPCRGFLRWAFYTPFLGVSAWHSKFSATPVTPYHQPPRIWWLFLHQCLTWRLWSWGYVVTHAWRELKSEATPLCLTPFSAQKQWPTPRAPPSKLAEISAPPRFGGEGRTSQVRDENTDLGTSSFPIYPAPLRSEVKSPRGPGPPLVQSPHVIIEELKSQGLQLLQLTTTMVPFSPFYKRKCWGSKKLRVLPEAMQPTRGRAGT